MDILVGVEDLVKLLQIGDDVFDGDVATYALSKVVDSVFVFGLVRFVSSLVLGPFSLGVRINMRVGVLDMDVVVVFLHDVTNLRYSFLDSVFKQLSYHL